MDARSRLNSDELLFSGVTFTTTDLNSKEKRQISDAVYSMGGKIKNDLTSETDVLIVGSVDTAKSKYCINNRTDVTLLYPDDLLDIYVKFKEKTNKLSIQILDDYPWPIFDSSLFCLSRLRDMENPCYEKNYISRLIHHFGGKYVASLTPRVTYLITDKREGKRYESALEWKINPIHPKWIVDCCNCQRILDPLLYDISRVKDFSQIGKNSHTKWRHVVDYGSVENNPIFDRVQKELKKIDAANQNRSLIREPLLKGFVFASYGFQEAQVQKLNQILKDNGAEFQDDYDLSITHVIIPSSFTLEQVPDKIINLKEISGTKIINEWFIERCLHYKKVMEDSWSLPLNNLFLDYSFKIHITGFTEIEHLHITKLVKNLNLTLSNELTENCDFLIANLSSLGLTKDNSPPIFNYRFNDILTSKANMTPAAITLTKKKINSAKKWDIPVLSLAFLWELAQTGILPHIIDSRWCVFAPKSLKPANNFLEYARSVSGGTFQTQANKPRHPESDVVRVQLSSHDEEQSHIQSNYRSSPTKLPVQLPSPRKNSTKKWPKLIGTASESQLKSTSTVDDNYEFRSARRLVFDENDNNNNEKDKDKGSFVDFEDNFGIDDIPVFKKRRF